MKLLNNRTRSTAPAPADDTPVRMAAAHWTRGQQLATTGTRFLLWVLIACAPISLVVGGLALAANRAVPRAVPATATTEPPDQLRAAGVAEQAVVAWLEASRTDTQQVDGLLPSADIPATALQVSDPAAVEAVWEGQAWVVTVAVTVTSQPVTADSSTGPAKQRRFFQVPVAVDAAGQLSVLMLPAEVAGPTLTPAAGDGFTSTVPLTHPVSVAASDFLAALLAGGGDITRYSAPESGIRAVQPAPYTAVTVESVKAASTPAAAADGDSIIVMVRARAQDDNTGAVTRFDYLLAMTLRSSRWEITQIMGSPSPAQEVNAPDPAASPVPTSTNS